MQLRTKTVRPRHGLAEELMGQCRATVSQSGVDIARGKTSGRKARHGEGRRERKDSLGYSPVEEKKGAWRTSVGCAKHLILLLESQTKCTPTCSRKGD